MGSFTGTLNVNEFYSGLFNAYKLIATFADGLDGLDNTLAERFKMEGGAYHDKSVWSDTDILETREWDPTDTNVLATEQKVKPVQQEIIVNQKRQIALTTDQYLTKRAWAEPGAFEQFNSIVQAQVGNTQKVYEQRLVNTSTGTIEAKMPNGKGSKQAQTVVIPTGTTEELRVRLIGRKIANIFVDVEDSTRDYNDYGFMKAYKKESMLIVWNAAYLNEFKYVDLPTIFHKDGIIEFTGVQLPGRYFGRSVLSSDIGEGKIIGANGAYDSTKGTIRAKKEFTYNQVHYFPGDALATNGTYISVSGLEASNVYIEDPTIICKIMHKDSIKYLSGFETSTEFWNPKNLTSNRYLTWIYADPDYLRNYPLITLREMATE